MVRTREIEPKRIGRTNFLPLLLDYFQGSPLQLARFMGVLYMWGLSGEPALRDFALRNRVGLSKSTVYRTHDHAVAIHKWLAERGYHFADEWECARVLLSTAEIPLVGKQTDISATV
jgi:hypothetical protein